RLTCPEGFRSSCRITTRRAEATFLRLCRLVPCSLRWVRNRDRSSSSGACLCLVRKKGASYNWSNMVNPQGQVCRVHDKFSILMAYEGAMVHLREDLDFDSKIDR